MQPRWTIFRALGVADGTGFEARPGAVLIEDDGEGRVQLLASGRVEEVERHPGAVGAGRVDVGRSVLLPALVNAHAHLDLTDVGPREYERERGFPGWLQMVLRSRATDEAGIRRATEHGIQKSLRGGVIAVGDIAGTGHIEPVEALRDSPMMGVSFVEYFGLGPRQAEAIDQMTSLARGGATVAHERVRMGLQPHAPYSAGIDVFNAAVALERETGAPVATHLSESVDEIEFIERGTGMLRELLQMIGVGDDVVRRHFGHGERPIRQLREPLAAAPILAAHVNVASDEEIEFLATTKTSVAWCPRGHRYFGHLEKVGPHRWREMVKAGINVAVGTDSIINLPPDETDRISTLDDLRLLSRTGEGDDALLLRLATINGAKALGLDELMFSLVPPVRAARPLAGLIAVEVGGIEPSESPLRAVMRSSAVPELIAPDPLAWPPVVVEVRT